MLACPERALTQADASTPAAQALARVATADPVRPFVVAQLGQSLDGRIATLTGESRYINGDEGLDHLHRLRAVVDAVVVGAGTIAVDDPQLTVRRAPGASPARVVIDPRGRVGGAGKWLADDGASRIVITAAQHAGPPGAEVVVLPARDGQIAPRDIVAALAARGLRRILIEGGARTISAFIDAGAVDRLHLIFGCTIIGSGRPGLQLEPLARLADALRPATEVYKLGSRDILFDCGLRDADGE
ncbi:MAG: RibD family protein [Rhodoblastus sp.]|nr:RibD family protein [Rhodoblastus sp.]